MHDNLLPCIGVVYGNRYSADADNAWNAPQLGDDKFGNDGCTKPNLTEFGLCSLHHMGMYGIILH